MNRPLIGQVLSRMGKLTAIDIDEILAEQAFSRRRFGEIAHSHGGFANGTHLRCVVQPARRRPGKARFVGHRHRRSGVTSLSGELARRTRVMPIRFIGDQLVVATARLMDAAQAAEICARARGGRCGLSRRNRSRSMRRSSSGIRGRREGNGHR